METEDLYSKESLDGHIEVDTGECHAFSLHL